MDELLAHRAWIRRLAQSLARDGSEADDLAQGTWLVALEHPPASRERLSGWLARVAQNLVRKRARGETRRQRRESAAPDPREPAPSPESLIERAELQQRLAALVLALEEPFRSTVLLRYFEELSPAEIAARLGIPAATVRSRLKRGLDELRARLDREHGGQRHAWLVPVGALGEARARHLSLTWKGVAIVKAKLGLAALVALLLATLLVVSTVASRHPQPTTAVPTARPTSTQLLRPARVARAWSDPSRPARSALEGIVRDSEGRPLDGALVGAVPEDSDADELHVHALAVAVSHDGGRFRIEGLRAGSYAAQATAPGLTAAYRPGLVLLDGDTASGIELQLGRGGVTIVARLRDSGGGPIAGGKLHARRHGEDRREVYTVGCGSDGACPITLTRGGYTLVAEAEGYAPARRDVIALAELTTELELQPAATLHGHVVERASGAAVPGATVALARGGAFLADSQVLADAAGAFEFRDLPPDEYQLSAHHGRLAGRSSSPVAVSIGAAAEATVALEPAATISGTVSGPSGPLAGATVLLRPARSTDHVIARVQTDAGGRYAIPGLLPGAYQLRAEARALAPAMRDLALGERDESSVDLTLLAGGTVSGTIFAKGHVPLAGAVVTAVVHDGELRTSSASARTGSDGRFHLDSLGSGLLFVDASHPEHGQVTAAPARLAAGEARECTLTFDEPGASIEGRVRWEDGAPAARVHVRASRLATQTDADGRFRLEPLPAGIHFVSAAREPGELVPRDPGGTPTVAVTLASDEHRESVELVLLRGGHRLAGRVLGPDGSPRGDALVRADPEDDAGTSLASGDPRVSFPKAISRADGSFTIDGLTAGRFTLTASHAGFPNASTPHVPADSTDAIVQLEPEAILAGVAVTSDGGPVTDYELTLFSSGADMMLPASQLAAHDPRGAFTLKGLSAGAYDLLAATSDGRTGRLSVRLADGEHGSGLRIVVGAGTTLRGRVVEYGTGLPIPHAQVTVLGAGAPLSTSSDATGAFSVRGLPPGRVAWIAASADERAYLYDRIRVTLPPGQPIVDAGAIQLIPGDARPRSVGWTGILPTNLDGVASVETVAPRSPAAEGGIRPGEPIVGVDGVSTAGLGFRALSYFLGGAPGTQVTIALAGRTVVVTRVPDPQ